jgi:multiple sugar transport system permease protein
MMAVDALTETTKNRATPARRPRLGRLGRREAIDGILMALPWIVGFVVFTAGPTLFGLYTSLTKWNIISKPQWVGFGNFSRMFSGKDRYFYRSLWVTIRYTVFSASLHIVLDFVLASLLNMKLKGTNLFRTIFYLPNILPLVASVVMWAWVFNPDFGLVNYGLRLIGVQGPKWYADEHWALPTIILMNIQYVGPGMVIMLAGLQRVPEELYEAAQLDGANRWQLTRHVTLPMVSSVIFFIILNHVSASATTFAQALFMTNGGPNYATYFYMLHLYNEAWGSFRMGYGSALALVLFLLILGFTVVQFRLQRYWVYTD